MGRMQGNFPHQEIGEKRSFVNISNIPKEANSGLKLTRCRRSRRTPTRNFLVSADTSST